MNFEEALQFMQGRLRLGWKLGNERLEALLERLGDPHRQLRVIHIAGTKGKGSTVTFAANILQQAGYSVGMYLSPYVYNVRERVQINNTPISEDDFARWVTAIRPHIEELEKTEHGPVTEFELKTAIAFCYFAEQAVDYAVLEVGLGGRLDATNVVPKPLVTAITNIGFDHMEYLGHTLREIAGEKAGIVKPGAPCITGVEPGGEADQAISEVCMAKGAPLFHVTKGVKLSQADSVYLTDFMGDLALSTPRRALSGIHLRLRGAFQHANAAVALAALDAIDPEHLTPISDDLVRRGLESAYLPGRLEKVAEHPTVIVDVGHNELASQVLADALRNDFRAHQRRLLLVVGMSRSHEPQPFLAPLLALEPALLVATQPSFRPQEASEVAEAARKLNAQRVEVVSTGVIDAVRLALREIRPDDILCVTGSFYTVGDIPAALWRELTAERKESYVWSRS